MNQLLDEVHVPEFAVLEAALATAPELASMITGALEPRFFSHSGRRAIFEALQVGAVDEDSAREWLNRNRPTLEASWSYQLDSLGLIRNRATPETVRAHITSIKADFTRRELRKLTGRIDQACTEGRELKDIAALLHRAVELLAGNTTTRILNAAQIMEAALNWVEEVLKAGGVSGYSTGLLYLDELLGGLAPGRMTIAGRPGCCKSVLTAQIAQAVAADQRRVLLCSLEMDAWEIGIRQLCGGAEIAGNDLLRHPDRLTVEQWEAVYGFARRFSQLDLKLVKEPSLTIDELELIARSEKPDLIVVDYLQLLKGGKGEKEDLRVGSIAQTLKTLALDLPNLHVVAAAQLNRESERNERPPWLSDLARAGGIEQAADTVLATYRSATTPQGMLRLYSLKNRSGKADHRPALNKEGPDFGVYLDLEWKAPIFKLEDSSSLPRGIY